MGIADDIKNLGEDIVTSYDSRVKAIGTLVKDTHQMLKGFRAEHKEMSGKQTKELAAFVEDLTKNVGNMVKSFHNDHKAMAEELKESLEKGEADRLKSFKSTMGDIQKGNKDIETYVKNKLKEFSDAHADMSEELKKELAEYVAGIVSETKKLLGGFADEREKMAAYWQALTATMAKRRGIKPAVDVEVKVRHVEEAIEKKPSPPEEKVEEKPQKEEMAEEEKPPAEEVVEEEKPLEEKIVEFIEKHPEGVKIGDMEEPLGVARTRLGVIAKKLLEEGKVRKEENLYFPL